MRAVFKLLSGTEDMWRNWSANSCSRKDILKNPVGSAGKVAVRKIGYIHGKCGVSSDSLEETNQDLASELPTESVRRSRGREVQATQQTSQRA